MCGAFFVSTFLEYHLPRNFFAWAQGKIWVGVVRRGDTRKEKLCKPGEVPKGKENNNKRGENSILILLWVDFLEKSEGLGRVW